MVTDATNNSANQIHQFSPRLFEQTDAPSDEVRQADDLSEGATRRDQQIVTIRLKCRPYEDDRMNDSNNRKSNSMYPN